MSKYVYQKFLLNCDYEDTEISDFPYYDGDLNKVLDYRCDYCLFDVGQLLVRKISVSDIDNQIDTEEDWNQLLKMLKEFELIVLYDCNINSSNPIMLNYREVTMKAYLYRLRENGISISVA